MKKQIINGISIFVGILVFVLLVKHFYFETKLGFSTEIWELNYSCFPAWFDICVGIISVSLIVYTGIKQFSSFIISKMENYIHKFQKN